MAFTQALQAVPHATAVVPVTCLAIFLIAKLIVSYFSPQARRLRSLPLLNVKDDSQLKLKLQEAFNKYGKNGEFYKYNESYHEMVMVPPRYMSEIKASPETSLSFSEELYTRYNGDLTGMGRFEPSFIKTITGDLTKHIQQFVPELVEETEYAFDQLVGKSGQPVSITMLPAAQYLIALLSSRIFVGSSLCHDEKWIDAMTVHTNYTFHASEKVWKYPQFLRNYIAPYLEDFKKMMGNRKEVERLLAPHISARQKAAFEGHADDFDDILTSLIQNAPADKKDDVAYHAQNQLQMSAAGMHTTAQVLTQNIFNLAAYPEVIEEMRQELYEVLPRDGAEKALMVTKPLLAKLIKLDSFMKETMRTNPLGLLSMNRIITSPTGLTLSNGLHLPHNSFTAINSYHIVQDPNLYPEPEKFDAFRFAKLTAKGGINSTKWQFTTVNPDFAAFGQGTHSCPGRFFANAEIKLALIYILLNYNVSFEPGQTRPANNVRGVLQSPNGQAKVVFAPRSDAWSLSGDFE